MSFYPEHIFRLIALSNAIIADIEAGTLTAGASHWELYARWADCAPWDIVPAHFTVIDDLTEDFDFPCDFIEWNARRRGRSVR